MPSGKRKARHARIDCMGADISPQKNEDQCTESISGLPFTSRSKLRTSNSTAMKKFRHLTKLAIGVATLINVSGCCGLAHSSAPCCGQFPGKYYRATRLDGCIIASRPILTPLVILTDLPFAIVIETIEVPFIAAGHYDPRPPEIPKPTASDRSEMERRIQTTSDTKVHESR